MTAGLLIAAAVILFVIVMAASSYSTAKWHDPELSEVRRRREEARNRQRELDDLERMHRRPD